MKVVLENLTKRFPSRNKKGEDVIAVNNFNFEIPDGRLIGLLGPSGCGKSTTLNLISGLETPTSGKVFFGDEDVTDLPPEARGVGLVFQNYALYPHLTVEENIIFPLQNLKGDRKMSKQAMHDKAVETAKLVQIDGLMERKPKELSGGQHQRGGVGMVLGVHLRPGRQKRPNHRCSRTASSSHQQDSHRLSQTGRVPQYGRAIPARPRILPRW